MTVTDDENIQAAINTVVMAELDRRSKALGYDGYWDAYRSEYKDGVRNGELIEALTDMLIDVRNNVSEDAVAAEYERLSAGGIL
jgi:hypothetical protein